MWKDSNVAPFLLTVVQCGFWILTPPAFRAALTCFGVVRVDGDVDVAALLNRAPPNTPNQNWTKRAQQAA